MSKSLKKIVEESREKNLPEVDMCDRGISNLLDIPGLCESVESYYTSLKFYVVLIKVWVMNLICLHCDQLAVNSKLSLFTAEDWWRHHVDVIMQ